jgi:hypothetical protein
VKNPLSGTKYANVTATLALVVALGGTGYAAATIGTSDIKDNAVTSAKIKNSNVKTRDIRNNAVKSAKVKDYSLSNQDVGVLFAQINSDGTTANSSGGVTSFGVFTGAYAVNFDRNVADCAFVATIAGPGDNTAGPGQVDVADLPEGLGNGVFVRTTNSNGGFVNTSFNLIVVC